VQENEIPAGQCINAHREYGQDSISAECSKVSKVTTKFSGLE